MPPQLPSKDSNCSISRYSKGESLSGNIRAVQELHSKGREHDYSPLAAGCIKDLMQSVPLEKITQAIKKDVPLSHLMKSSKHCSSPGTRAALWSKGKAAVALVSPFWRQEPMGKAAAPLAVKQICRHSRAVSLPQRVRQTLIPMEEPKQRLAAITHWFPLESRGSQGCRNRTNSPRPGAAGSFNTSQGLLVKRRVSDTAIPLKSGTLGTQSTC